MTKPDDKPKTEPKPEKTKVLQVQLLVTLEVPEGDLATAAETVESIKRVPSVVDVKNKKTGTVTR